MWTVLSMLTLVKSFSEKYPFVKWAFVGAITFSVDVLSFLVAYKITKSVIIANTVAVFSAQGFNYIAHYLWSFRSEASHSQSFIKYVFVTFLWWFFGVVLITLFIKVGLPVYISKILPILIMTPFNFFVLKNFVYKNK
jgi:putative flippase GtrA